MKINRFTVHFATKKTQLWKLLANIGWLMNIAEAEGWIILDCLLVYNYINKPIQWAPLHVPHFIWEKVGFAGIYIVFFCQNINIISDCENRPVKVVLTSTPKTMFGPWIRKKLSQIFIWKLSFMESWKVTQNCTGMLLQYLSCSFIYLSLDPRRPDCLAEVKLYSLNPCPAQ